MARTVRPAGLFAVLAVAAAGCVDRKFIIESNVPNAQVYLDNRSLGAAPAYAQFDYYGHYNITVIQPGYETVVKREHVTAPWYAYPPFDLLAAIAPFPIRDHRRIYIELVEAPPIRTDDILTKADALRQRGMMLPPPETPALPRTKAEPSKPAGPVVPPPLVPGPEPLPGPAPGVVPNVAPGYSPVPGTPPPGPAAVPGAAPNVAPAYTPAPGIGPYVPGYPPGPRAPSPGPFAVPGSGPAPAPSAVPNAAPGTVPPLESTFIK